MIIRRRRGRGAHLPLTSDTIAMRLVGEKVIVPNNDLRVPQG